MAQSQPIRGSETRHEMTRKRPVDLDHLSRQTSGDPIVEREALSLFVVQSRLCLQRLRQAMGERDRADRHGGALQRVRGVGAWGIADHAETLERLCTEGSHDSFRDLLVDLESEIDEVGAFVRHLYTEH